MDWDLKMPPWEMAEMEANAEPNIGSIVGSSSGMRIQSSGLGLDCSVDLKLGDFGWKDNTGGPISSSGKRARPLSSGSHQNVSCLVDGCRSDLSGCKEYHRRHKVCETHSKSPIVMVGGKEQRFCQQCSRFHLLVEFDDVKRSCRKRLDGHNRRRRKPQSESINSANMFSDHQGTRFSSYPQIFPTAASDPTWPVIVKSEEEPLYARHSPMHSLNSQHHHFPVPLARSFKEGKNFPFSQETDRLCQPLRTIASAESSSSGGKIFPVLESDCALSLLSSPPQTSSINLGQTGDRNPMGRPLLSYGGRLGLARYSGSHQTSNHVSTTGFSCSGMEEENIGSTVLVSDSNDCFFGVGGEGSSDGGTQALPFSWQ